MSAKNLKSLIGRWEPCDKSSPVVVEIHDTAVGPKVRAFNKDDGEEFVVSKVEWDGKALRFETSVPSNKWRTKNIFRPTSKTKVMQELTFWEPWKKVRSDQVLKTPSRRVSEGSKSIHATAARSQKL
jgi:hypothetical protein